jgi:hypothetical protein
MRYTIELDTSTKAGSEMLQYLRKHNAGKVVSIQKWEKLTAQQVALPEGIVPTEWQWEEYLNRKQGKGKPAEKAFAAMRKKLKGKSGE